MLELYPSITANSTVDMTVLHPCKFTEIKSQTMTPIDYQIQYSGITQTILSFTMHQDTVGIA